MHYTRSAATTAGDPLHSLAPYAAATVTGLLPHDADAPRDITFGEVLLPAGAEVAPHSVNQPATLMLTEGSLRVWRRGGSVEVHAPSAVYVPRDEPVAIVALGDADARFLLSFAHGGDDRSIVATELDDEAFASDTNPNDMPFGPIVKRWVASADFARWEGVEPSKGMRLRCKYLLDGGSGTPDFTVGLAAVDPQLHYTIHRHAPAEIYYVMSGTGRIYVGDEGYDVAPGDTVYVPSYGPHGIDTADEQLEIYWFYATDVHESWAWEPLEPVYSDPPRRPLESGPRRGFHDHS